MNVNGRLGQNVSLICSASGSPTPAITWFRNGMLIDGEIFPSLNFPSLSPEDRGFYFCMANNTVGSIRSDTVLVSIQGTQLLFM